MIAITKIKEILSKYNAFLLLVLSVFILYLANLPIDYAKDLENGLYRRMLPSDDVIPNTFLPYVLIKERTFNFTSIYNTLNTFDEPEHKENPYFLIPTAKGYVSSYPVLTGLFATPIYYFPLVLDKIPELTYHENILKLALLGRVAAAFYSALSVGIFYLICLKVSNNNKLSLIFSIFYAFGTGTYSISSRGLWMHTISQFLFSITLLLLLLPDERKHKYLAVGLTLGLNVINRPTGIVMAIVILIYVLIYKRKYFFSFLAGILPTFAAYLFNNYYLFGSVFSEGYTARGAANEWTGSWLQSIPAFLVSPARGFLFISPPLLLGFAGMYKKMKEKDTLYTFLTIGYIGSVLLIGKWYAWHGANAFGHRMLVDYLPFIGLFSFLAVKDLKNNLLGIIVILMILSVYVHLNAVINRKSRCDEAHNWTFYCLKWPDRPPQY